MRCIFILVVKDERPWGMSIIEWRKLQEESSPVEQSTPSDSEGRSDTDLPASV